MTENTGIQICRRQLIMTEISALPVVSSMTGRAICAYPVMEVVFWSLMTHLAVLAKVSRQYVMFEILGY
jgi:hypothetical protein